MDVKEIVNKNSWNEALQSFENVPFTQSWEWGEILIGEGKKVYRLVVEEERKVCAAAQMVENGFGVFKYGFCPKGPMFAKVSTQKKEALALMVGFLKKQGAMLFRVEMESVFLNEGLLKTIDINPRATTVLDLNISEVDLMAKMHSKTRYNINLAGKKELVIKNEKNWEAFWGLMKKTGERDGFRLHDEKHYREILNSATSIQLTAFIKGAPIASVVLFGFGNTLTYLFGASDYQHRKLMAPQLLQWEGIRLGKERGYESYDFFGIAPHRMSDVGSRKSDPISDIRDLKSEYEYDEEHQYAGVTRFKLGFGGEVAERPGTYDLIISPGKYKMYQVLRKIRRWV